MKKCLTVLLFMSLAHYCKSNHITGGEMYYSFAGIVNGQYQYHVTLKLYMRCNSGRLFANPNTVSVFNRATTERVMDISVPLDHIATISLPPDPCITNPPEVCYEIGVYYFTVSLPASTAGYTLASEVNFRINGITNLAPYSQIGATYTCEIPGNGTVATGPQNNSALFTGSDLVVVCADNMMSYSFAANDEDGDQLLYSFCTAYNSTTGGTSNGSPAGPPPYPPLAYNLPAISETSPLGDNIHIDPSTGMITGIAPQPGIYVVTVCVQEIRNGVVIATQRKDLQINIADCSIASAQLNDAYSLCRSTQTISIVNQSNSPLITSWNWTVYDAAGNVIFATDTEDLNYTFSTAGVYSIKLVVNQGQPCSDEDTASVYVFPGFELDFDVAGLCLGRPTFFTDQTTTSFGVVNSWKWDFGDLTTTTDISTSQNPSYTYPSTGVLNVKLVVTNSVGCRDTLIKAITIVDKPLLGLLFRDTLICANDVVQLQATAPGAYSWTPTTNMINANTATPTVSPTVTTLYYAELDDNGCRNKDSVKVRVVNQVTLQAMNDTTVCQGDLIQLRVFSDGLSFAWTPSSQLSNSTVQNPVATTPATTNYQVTARIGGCVANENIIVTAVAYPLADAGPDITICYNTKTQLNGNSDGTTWLWSPSSNLSDPRSLNPIASPAGTTAYIFTCFDNRGCPKPGKDTVVVTVLPKIDLSAGKDTSVIIGQPLQLQASGADFYSWSPGTYLSAVNISNPVANFNEVSSGHVFKLTGANSSGCVDSVFINVKVFATAPSVFVPTAFTPNNDGRNDILRPLAVGMKQIDYFRVFNRWGQLVFSTSINGHGWDGRIGGQLQTTNSFVWVVKAVDFRGIPYFQKGITTLIR